MILYRTCLMIILLVFSCVYDLVGETKKSKRVDLLNSKSILDKNKSLGRTFKTKLAKNVKIPNSEKSAKLNLAHLRNAKVFQDHGGDEIPMQWKYVRFKRKAQGFDACVSGPCKNGGMCIAKAISGYECFCPDKYAGDQCEIFNANQQSRPGALGVGECDSKPCKNRGKCIATPPRGYECFCMANYIGDKCEMYYNPESEAATHTGIFTSSKHDEPGADSMVLVRQSAHSLMFRATVTAAIVVLSIFAAIAVIGLIICCIANARVNRLRRRMNRKLERGENLVSLPPTFCAECKKMTVDFLVCRFCCCCANESSEEEQPLNPVKRTSSANVRHTRPARSESREQRNVPAPVSDSDDDEGIMTRYHGDDLAPERKSSRKIHFTQSNNDDQRASRHGNLNKVPVRRNMSTHALSPRVKSLMASRERVITGLSPWKSQTVLRDRVVTDLSQRNSHVAQSEHSNQSKNRSRKSRERSPLIARHGYKAVPEKRSSNVRSKRIFRPRIDHMKQESSSDLDADTWSDSDVSHAQTDPHVDATSRKTPHRNKAWLGEECYPPENDYCRYQDRHTADTRHRDRRQYANQSQSCTSHLFNVSMLTPPVTPTPLPPPAPFNRY